MLFRSNSDLFKEFFYHNNLKSYIERGIPVFGICLGFQQLNVFFGGKITQHLPNYNINDYSVPREQLIQSCDIVAGWSKYKTQLVNSLHHQGVQLSDLSTELNAIATSQYGEITLVEAFIHKSLAVAAVQWHPEHIIDEVSTNLVNHLLTIK